MSYKLKLNASVDWICKARYDRRKQVHALQIGGSWFESYE